MVSTELPVQPAGKTQMEKASLRITAAFLVLLEQQFPIESQHPVQLRSASQFANRLDIHVNHLNRMLKETLNKTTTQVISERILQEAKALLRDHNMSVADIAYVLGFTEATHFNSFFRKYTKVTPTEFRSTIRPL
ncbi:MAG TPA: helix-turn-helix transcriptional regulator [Chryseolinea sp.]|nr:helix-turn-helix transcriptional regulator [Chryseolinea sp.]